MDAADGFDRVFAALPRSRAYREAVRAAVPELPEWLVPYNGIGAGELARIARETGAAEGDAFVDLGCGTGGPGVWIARHTGASIAGVDFSPAAVREATALAQARGIADRAQFVVAGIEATGLPGSRYAAAVCIDALVFVDPAAAAREIARLVRPKGIAVATSWESLGGDAVLPTMVRDYRPCFEEAGFSIRTHEVLEGWRERQAILYRALLEREAALLAEMGDAASSLLEEAREGLARERLPPRVRKVLIVAERR
jgi:SAM-dependent methyltransferase